jgi:hypothetical protein
MDYWCKNINSFLSLRYFTKFTGLFKDYPDKIHKRTLIYVEGSDFIRQGIKMLD